MLLAAVCLVQWVLASYSTTVLLWRFVYFGLFISPVLAVIWITRDKRKPELKKRVQTPVANPQAAPLRDDNCDDAKHHRPVGKVEVIAKFSDDGQIFDSSATASTLPVTAPKQSESKIEPLDRAKVNFAIEYPYRPLLPSDSSQSIGAFTVRHIPNAQCKSLGSSKG
jgi:hypothetical protein